MQAFISVNGAAVAVLRANVDTDIIIRIDRLTSIAQDQLGPYAFEALRSLPDGSPDPAFGPNQPAFRDAPVLLAGANFGCGSSRESAVWALQAMGVRCVIAPSFGDIFANNCYQNGVLPLVLPAAQLDQLAAHAADGSAVTVDLRDCTISAAGGWQATFALDPLRRASLLAGLDEIGLTLLHEARIRAWQLADRASRPWIWQLDHLPYGRVQTSKPVQPSTPLEPSC